MSEIFDPKAAIHQARTFVSQGNKQEAYRVLREALGHNPNNEDVLIEIANVIRDTPHQASLVLHRVLQNNPSNQVARRMLAELASSNQQAQSTTPSNLPYQNQSSSAYSSTVEAKLNLVSEIGKLEGETAQLENSISNCRDRIRKIEKESSGGALGILLGILLIPAFGIGLVLIGAGILTAITGSSKKAGAQTELAQLEARLVNTRSRLASLRAQLVIL